MSLKNYTAIDDLIEKQQPSSAWSRPKEAEPILATKGEVEIKEVVEHKPEEEVRAFVSARHETIELPPDLKRLGLQASATTQFPNYQNIKLPISDDKIIFGLHAPVSSSLRWLATLAIYLLQKAHLGLKVVHGRVIRILRR